MKNTNAPVVSGSNGISDDHLGAATATGSIAYAPPVVQFRTLGSFIDDLDRGRVVAVYHDLKPGSRVTDDTCVFRALVAVGTDIYVASAAVRLPELRMMGASGKTITPTEWEVREHNERCYGKLVEMVAERLGEIGVLGLRPGVIGVSYHLDAVYCRDLPEPKVVVVIREGE